MAATSSTPRSLASRFTDVYDSLPRDAQQTLVYKHLIPLLDTAPKAKSRRAIAAAGRQHQRHAQIPQLDIRSKEAEITAMLRELTKDAKRSCVTDHSLRTELLEEIVNSLTTWLNDIWRVAYEHNVDFALAHDCLLFVSSTLERLASMRMGCKCSLNSMYIPVVLKSRKGKRVKRFDLDGASHIEEVTLFIWRDLFLAMLAHGTQKHKDLIPRMLSDIENAISWKALVKLLYGGRRDMKTAEDALSEGSWEDVSDADDDKNVDTYHDDTFDDVTQPRLMHHWSDIVARQLPVLKRQVEMALLSTFEAAPSMELYNTLLGIADDPVSLEERLMQSIRSVATACPDTFAVALDIYTFRRRTDLVIGLLDHHSHLLRPRDAPTLQCAASLLSHDGHAALALRILEAEMLDTVRTIRQALSLSFSQMETPANKLELAQILKQRAGAAGRRDRVEAWVDAITTPGAGAPQPMMFAMFMGIAPMPGMNTDDDPFTYLDLDPSDPDLDDLRAEYRPNLKKRFEGWADIGLTMRGGTHTLLSIYKKIIETLPFLRATDVSEEIINRLGERPSKQHVCDGLDALLAFVKVQRRKWRATKSDMQKRKAAEAPRPTSQPSLSSPGVGTPASTSQSLRFMDPAPTPSGSPPQTSSSPSPSSAGPSLSFSEPSQFWASLTPSTPPVGEGTGIAAQPAVPEPRASSSSSTPSEDGEDSSAANGPLEDGHPPLSILSLLMGLGPFVVPGPGVDNGPTVGGVDDVD